MAHPVADRERGGRVDRSEDGEVRPEATGGEGRAEAGERPSHRTDHGQPDALSGDVAGLADGVEHQQGVDELGHHQVGAPRSDLAAPHADAHIGCREGRRDVIEDQPHRVARALLVPHRLEHLDTR